MDATELWNEALKTSLTAIVAQITALNWTLIIAGAGIGEVISTRAATKKAKMHWSAPLVMGFIFGVPQFLQTGDIGMGFFKYINTAFVSGCTYAGLIVLVYVLTVRPFRALADRLAGKKEVQVIQVPVPGPTSAPDESKP
jgi:hypothetical protein